MQTADIDAISSKSDFKASSFSSDLKSEIELRSSNEKETESKTNRFYYTVGSYNLLIEQEIRVENLTNFIVNKIPHAPEWCTGIVNIRGIIMPVVSMHTFLKTGTNNSKRISKLIMLEHKNHAPIIFQIDKLPKMIFLDDYAHEKAPDKSPNWLINALKNGTNTLYKIDHSKLMAQLKNTQI